MRWPGRRQATGVIVAALIGAAWVGPGCGGDDGGVGEVASAQLTDRVAGVRATALADPDAARLHLAALRAEVEGLRQAGDLTDAAGDDILDAADGVEAALAPPSAAPTTAPPSEQPVDQQPVDQQPDDQEPDGKDEREGKDNKKGDDEDDDREEEEEEED